MIDTRLSEADRMAEMAHGSIGQKRKGSGLPYIVHPRAVRDILVSIDAATDTQCAGLLHDTLEDPTGMTLAEIERCLGRNVALLVDEVTDRGSDANRPERNRANATRRALISAEGQDITAADLLDNVKDVVEWDPSFATVYLPEKLYLLKHLPRANPKLVAAAHEAIAAGFRKLAGQG